ncbi:MAG: hypothetical protein ACTHU7_07435 [Microbacterium sp.]
MDFEPALAYETDWTWINWLWVGILAVASATWVFAARPALGWASEFDVGYSRGAELRKGALLLGWLLVTLTAGITILSWPGAVMRHIPEPAYVLLTVAVGIIAAIALALWGMLNEEVAWFGIVPAVTLATGFLLGGIVDWLNRVAASIPTSVSALVGGVVLALVLIVAWSRSTAR